MLKCVLKNVIIYKCNFRVISCFARLQFWQFASIGCHINMHNIKVWHYALYAAHWSEKILVSGLTNFWISGTRLCAIRSSYRQVPLSARHVHQPLSGRKFRQLLLQLFIFQLSNSPGLFQWNFQPCFEFFVRIQILAENAVRWHDCFKGLLLVLYFIRPAVFYYCTVLLPYIQ